MEILNDVRCHTVEKAYSPLDKCRTDEWYMNCQGYSVVERRKERSLYIRVYKRTI